MTAALGPTPLWTHVHTRMHTPVLGDIFICVFLSTLAMTAVYEETLLLGTLQDESFSLEYHPRLLPTRRPRTSGTHLTSEEPMCLTLGRRRQKWKSPHSVATRPLMTKKSFP
jgi:hypothetical protein